MAGRVAQSGHKSRSGHVFGSPESAASNASERRLRCSDETEYSVSVKLRVP